MTLEQKEKQYRYLSWSIAAFLLLSTYLLTSKLMILDFLTPIFLVVAPWVFPLPQKESSSKRTILWLIVLIIGAMYSAVFAIYLANKFDFWRWWVIWLILAMDAALVCYAIIAIMKAKKRTRTGESS